MAGLFLGKLAVQNVDVSGSPVVDLLLTERVLQNQELLRGGLRVLALTDVQPDVLRAGLLPDRADFHQLGCFQVGLASNWGNLAVRNLIRREPASNAGRQITLLLSRSSEKPFYL